MMKLAVVALVFLGIVAAGAAVMTVKAFVLTESPEGITVLVADRDLDQMTKITAQHIVERQVSRGALPEGTDFLIDPIQAVGKVLTKKISQGQLFTRSCFLSEEEAERFSIEIPEGRRAFTVSLPTNSVMGGLLYPRCRVDVYSVFDLRQVSEGEAVSTELLQGIEVLAVEYRTIISDRDSASIDNRRESPAVRVTFSLTPDEVKTLQLSVRKGTIVLALRNPKDDTIKDPAQIFFNDGIIYGPTVERSGAANPIVQDPNEARPTHKASIGPSSVQVVRGPHITTVSLHQKGSPDKISDRSEVREEPGQIKLR